MKRLQLIMLVLLVLPSIATAQAQSCTIYFTVVQSDPHLPGGSISAMSKQQEEWWAKKGAKKYPAACYDPSKASYKIVWWRDVVSDNRVVNNTSDSRFDVTVKGTRDIGYAYVKQVGSPDADKPLFFVDRDKGGTADALEKALKFLVQSATRHD
jgi:hypothetical protein